MWSAASIGIGKRRAGRRQRGMHDSFCLYRLSSGSTKPLGTQSDELISLFNIFFCSGARGSETWQRTLRHHEISALSPCIPTNEPPPTEFLRPHSASRHSSSRATPDNVSRAAKPPKAESSRKTQPTNRPLLSFDLTPDQSYENATENR